MEKLGTGGSSISWQPNSYGVTAFNNFGQVDVQAGWLEFYGGYTQAEGETRLSGGSIASSTPLDIQGGILTGSGRIEERAWLGRNIPGVPAGTTGTLTINGVTQPAIPEAGGPYTVDEGGSVQLTGSVSASTGVLNIEIGGRDVGQFDQLHVRDSVILSGTLNLDLADGVPLETGDRFVIVANDDNGGTKDAVVGRFADFPEGATLSVDGKFFRSAIKAAMETT